MKIFALGLLVGLLLVSPAMGQRTIEKEKGFPLNTVIIEPNAMFCFKKDDVVKLVDLWAKDPEASKKFYEEAECYVSSFQIIYIEKVHSATRDGVKLNVFRGISQNIEVFVITDWEAYVPKPKGAVDT